MAIGILRPTPVMTTRLPFHTEKKNLAVILASRFHFLTQEDPKYHDMLSMMYLYTLLSCIPSQLLIPGMNFV